MSSAVANALAAGGLLLAASNAARFGGSGISVSGVEAQAASPEPKITSSPHTNLRPVMA